jgi:hypothetical protein
MDTAFGEKFSYSLSGCRSIEWFKSFYELRFQSIILRIQGFKAIMRKSFIRPYLKAHALSEVAQWASFFALSNLSLIGGRPWQLN